jgi:phosphoglycolate phosphatase-like HAD superfamily hydrolase
MASILDESWVQLLPGIETLLPRLAENSAVQLGLLTGNLRETAYLKLRLGGIDKYFPFGAFGSDHADRYQLPSIALSRAYEFTGYRYDGSQVVIIGDTEHDIGCGRGISALSVAVCTGRYGREELSAFDPDFLLDDLKDTDAVMAILAGP